CVPALLTTMSRPPKASTVRSTSALTSRATRMSALTPTASIADPTSSSTAAPSMVSLRPQIATLQPSSPSRRAMARPMPLVAPLTSAALPVNPRSISPHFASTENVAVIAAIDAHRAAGHEPGAVGHQVRHQVGHLLGPAEAAQHVGAGEAGRRRGAVHPALAHLLVDQGGEQLGLDVLGADGVNADVVPGQRIGGRFCDGEQGGVGDARWKPVGMRMPCRLADNVDNAPVALRLHDRRHGADRQEEAEGLVMQLSLQDIYGRILH